MRIAELEEMMNEDPSEAEAAIAELVSTSNVEELSRIATTGRVESLKLRAIEGLGEVGGPAAGAVLMELLEATSRPFLEGGSEQRVEHERRQGRLVQSLAAAKRLPAPTVRSQRDITEFIESCRNRS